MKKKMKSKLIAAVMSLAMVFTMMPMMGAPVYADDTASEPLYAVLDSKDGSLTFKREAGTYTDGQEVGTLTYYTVDEDFDYTYTTGNRPSWLAKAKGIKKVDFQTVVAPKSCVCWFDYCENLKEVVNADRLKTSRVTSMRLMFNDCTSLASIDTSKWNTSKVDDMASMFYGCSSLESLEVSNWDTSKVTDMEVMFYGCTSLADLEVSNWNTSKVADMGGMFSGCSELATLDVSGWDTSKVTDIAGMFGNCSSLASLDVSGWDTSEVAGMGSMFNFCSSLTSLDVSGWNTSKVKSMAYMFNNCTSLASLDVSGWDTGSVEIMMGMFEGCSKLDFLDLSGWNTSNAENMQNMFDGCESLSGVRLGENFSFKGGVGNRDWYAVLPNAPASLGHDGKWINESVTGAVGVKAGDLRDGYPNDANPSLAPGTYVWEGTTKVAVFDSKDGSLTFKREADMYDNGDTDGTKTYYTGFEDNKYSNHGQVPWYDKRYDIEKVDFQATVAPKSCTFWFYDCPNLAEVQGADRLITSKVESMDQMFYHCSSLGTLDVSGWNTGSVKTMFGMFYHCSSLGTLDVSGWNTSKVELMSDMFNQCSSLGTLEVSRWDTSKVMDMEAMFYGCASLADLEVSKWNTSKVADMSGMFSGCSSLASLDVSGWDTSRVGAMRDMFSGCSSLSGVTLGGDFSFKGNVSTPNWYAVLPDAPESLGHGGRWINESVPGAKGVTAADLRDNYPSTADPGFAPGTYRWEGHALTGTAEKKASCTEAGNSAYWFCSVCEKYFSDDAGTNKIEKDSWIIPATGHSMTRHNAVAPTCTKNGNVEYYACGICKKNFSDEQGNNEPDSIIDPKTGHKYGPWKKQNDKQHQKICEHDKSHVIKENHKWDAGKVTKTATEQAEGVNTYTCTVCKATKTEAIPKLKTSGTPLAKAAVKKKSMTIGWSKIQGAEGYDIFFDTCNHSGKKMACKNVKTIKGNKTFKWTKSGLRKGTPYKFYVRAYVTKNGKKTYVSKSPMMHAYTGNGTKYYTNAKSVTIKNVKKGKLSLSKGKTFKIKAKANKVNKKKKLMPKGHAPALRYMTSNKKIATVNSSGKIKAKGKGTCSIYVYAHNGVSRSIKVTVK